MELVATIKPAWNETSMTKLIDLVKSMKELPAVFKDNLLKNVQRHYIGVVSIIKLNLCLYGI